MDKRILKTDAAIYAAFGACLKEKDFASISVEDILKKSGISRSTFYAHFKAKDDVLDSLLDTIFEHVFSHSLHEEQSHDFSHESVLDYKHLFTHTLYHLKDEEELIRTILNSSCKDRFLNGLRRHIRPLMERVIREGVLPKKPIPEELQISSALESLIALVIFWFDERCAQSPEEMTDYFLTLNQ